MLTFLAFTFTLPKKCQVLFAIKIFSNYEKNTYLPPKKGYKYTHFASFVIDKKSFSLLIWHFGSKVEISRSKKKFLISVPGT